MIRAGSSRKRECGGLESQRGEVWEIEEVRTGQGSKVRECGEFESIAEDARDGLRIASSLGSLELVGIGRGWSWRRLG